MKTYRLLRITPIVLVAASLSACSAMQSNDPASLAFSIPAGSNLVLNTEATIAPDNTHFTIQYGKFVEDNARQHYEVNCRVDFKEFGPRQIQPETFRVRRTEDGTNWVSVRVTMRYYTEVYLDSYRGTDVIKMVCQQYGGPADNHFTVADMQKALGGLINIEFTPATTVE